MLGTSEGKCHICGRPTNYITIIEGTMLFVCKHGCILKKDNNGNN